MDVCVELKKGRRGLEAKNIISEAKPTIAAISEYFWMKGKVTDCGDVRNVCSLEVL